jgi:hypothetical protein
MAGGLIVLTAYAAQNVLLSGNPNFTFFKKAFRKYTHFSMETINLAFETTADLRQSDTTFLRAKITRNADLLSDLYLKVSLPAIYSKYLQPQSGGRTCQWEFQWVRYIGAALINRIAFFIGPNKIQEFDGTYLLSKALLDYDQDKFAKWRQLVGDVFELNNPALGSFSGGDNNTGYPTVLPNSSSGTVANRPSIPARDLYIPLGLWFTEAPSQALPLVGLQYQDVTVEITLNPINTLYTILDDRGYRVAPPYKNIGTAAENELNNPDYGAVTQLTDTSIRQFLVDIGATTPAIDSWPLNPSLEATYIYLPSEEQQLFATKQQMYVVNQVTAYPFPNQYNINTQQLQTHNPINRLLIVPRRSDTRNRNDFSNFTNWVNYPYAPFQPTPNATAYLAFAKSSGLLVPNSQQDILRRIRVLCDGTEIQQPKPTEFFTRLSTYRYTTGVGQDGLALYSFQLQSSPTQPSGSVNASRIRNFEVETDVWPLPVNNNYTYDLNIYVENINWLIIVSGSGALYYAL